MGSYDWKILLINHYGDYTGVFIKSLNTCYVLNGNSSTFFKKIPTTGSPYNNTKGYYFFEPGSYNYYGFYFSDDYTKIYRVQYNSTHDKYLTPDNPGDAMTSHVTILY